MHLAVKCAEESKSSRSVRHLLIKGADRRIRNLDGRTAKEVSQQIGNPITRQELENFLREPDNCQCFMFKGPPLKRLRKNNRAAYMYLLFILLSFLVFYFFKYTSKLFFLHMTLRLFIFYSIPIEDVSYWIIWYFYDFIFLLLAKRPWLYQTRLIHKFYGDYRVIRPKSSLP